MILRLFCLHTNKKKGRFTGRETEKLNFQPLYFITFETQQQGGDSVLLWSTKMVYLFEEYFWVQEKFCVLFTCKLFIGGHSSYHLKAEFDISFKNTNLGLFSLLLSSWFQELKVLYFSNSWESCMLTPALLFHERSSLYLYLVLISTNI